MPVDTSIGDPTTEAISTDCDVLIVGAGPAGLTLANLLGAYDLSVIVIERNDELVDYPRGVSLDDESLRVFQAIGLADAVQKHTLPDQWIRYITPKGRCFATVEPRARPFGWPRRNSFVQPLVDRVLLEGLARFPKVRVRFGCALNTLKQDAQRATAQVEDASGEKRRIVSRFIVGCDGGRSTVRKSLDIAFHGETDSTRWLVVDLRNDPLGTPDAYLFCDPARPHLSIALPHGIRRFEFMVFDNETDEDVTSTAGLQRLLSLVLQTPSAADIIRARVYTHHARLAERFGDSRVLLAGDAAHLMPVWQGQGFNSGIRDASNLAWKLAAVVKGMAHRRLVDTYDLERREHAAAMISISVLVGRIFSPTNRFLASLRDALTFVLGAIPAVRTYILQMRFKPMPFYSKGALIHDIPSLKVKAPSPVGRMFPQPMVTTLSGVTLRFDDAIEPWFAVVSYGLDPQLHMNAQTKAFWRRMNACFVSIVPPTQAPKAADTISDESPIMLLDTTSEFKEWFGRHQASIVVVRPDRFVAAATTMANISDATSRLRAALSADDTTPSR